MASQPEPRQDAALYIPPPSVDGTLLVLRLYTEEWPPTVYAALTIVAYRISRIKSPDEIHRRWERPVGSSVSLSAWRLNSVMALRSPVQFKSLWLFAKSQDCSLACPLWGHTCSELWCKSGRVARIGSADLLPSGAMCMRTDWLRPCHFHWSSTQQSSQRDSFHIAGLSPHLRQFSRSILLIVPYSERHRNITLPLSGNFLGNFSGTSEFQHRSHVSPAL
jgi:hypothetical protein